MSALRLPPKVPEGRRTKSTELCAREDRAEGTGHSACESYPFWAWPTSKAPDRRGRLGKSSNTLLGPGSKLSVSPDRDLHMAGDSSGLQAICLPGQPPHPPYPNSLLLGFPAGVV